MVLLLGFLQLFIESFDGLLDVLVLDLQVAFGLGYAVLEQLEFGVEGVADVEDVVASLVGAFVDFLHLVLETVQFLLYSVLLLLDFWGFAL